MTDLKTILTGAAQDAVVADISDLITKSVSDMSGVGGVAVKGAMAAATKYDSEIVSKVVSRLLPDIAEGLNPKWLAFLASGDSDFGAYLDSQKADVASSILEITDQRAQEEGNPTLSKIYGTVRSKGAQAIEANAGNIGTIIQRHAG
ncbi:DUF6918 family protein [Corynebacterium freiburgense]|uniref:DUF6918 family protein n=1 Tax=Corynebacterium freiburgense TaxID=556548 RepID=UPI0003F81798|nr:hypothetical protein [Corynebacterium freiburgense]WJZ01326.1 hypothetical protein CFREI_00030 [Corynebacterium freiburgense]